MDTKYTGTRTEEDKESLKRQTQLGEGTSKKVPLGLARPATSRGGAAPPSDISDGEDFDDDGDDDENDESGSEDADKNRDDSPSESPQTKKSRAKPKPKGRKAKRKRDEVEEEMPDEASMVITRTHIECL